jgi:hypothetical protein
MPLRKPYMIALFNALSVLTMLSGCGASVDNTTAVPVVDIDAMVLAALSDLSPEDERRCYDPGVPDGVDALEIIAEHRVALSDCRQRHGRVVALNTEIVGILTQPREKANAEGL